MHPTIIIDNALRQQMRGDLEKTKCEHKEVRCAHSIAARTESFFCFHCQYDGFAHHFDIIADRCCYSPALCLLLL